MSSFDDMVKEYTAIPRDVASQFLLELRRPTVAPNAPEKTAAVHAGLLKLATIEALQETSQDPESVNAIAAEEAVTDPNIQAALDYQQVIAEREHFAEVAREAEERAQAAEQQAGMAQQQAEAAQQQASEVTEQAQAEAQQRRAATQEAIAAKDQSLQEQMLSADKRQELVAQGEELKAQLEQAQIQEQEQAMGKQELLEQLKAAIDEYQHNAAVNPVAEMQAQQQEQALATGVDPNQAATQGTQKEIEEAQRADQKAQEQAQQAEMAQQQEQQQQLAQQPVPEPPVLDPQQQQGAQQPAPQGIGKIGSLASASGKIIDVFLGSGNASKAARIGLNAFDQSIPGAGLGAAAGAMGDKEDRWRGARRGAVIGGVAGAAGGAGTGAVVNKNFNTLQRNAMAQIGRNLTPREVAMHAKAHGSLAPRGIYGHINNASKAVSIGTAYGVGSLPEQLNKTGSIADFLKTANVLRITTRAAEERIPTFAREVLDLAPAKVKIPKAKAKRVPTATPDAPAPSDNSLAKGLAAGGVIGGVAGTTAGVISSRRPRSEQVKTGAAIPKKVPGINSGIFAARIGATSPRDAFIDTLGEALVSSSAGAGIGGLVGGGIGALVDEEDRWRGMAGGALGGTIAGALGGAAKGAIRETYANKMRQAMSDIPRRHASMQHLEQAAKAVERRDVADALATIATTVAVPSAAIATAIIGKKEEKDEQVKTGSASSEFVRWVGKTVPGKGKVRVNSLPNSTPFENLVRGDAQTDRGVRILVPTLAAGSLAAIVGAHTLPKYKDKIKDVADSSKSSAVSSYKKFKTGSAIPAKVAQLRFGVVKEGWNQLEHPKLGKGVMSSEGGVFMQQDKKRDLQVLHFRDQNRYNQVSDQFSKARGMKVLTQNKNLTALRGPQGNSIILSWAGEDGAKKKEAGASYYNSAAQSALRYGLIGGAAGAPIGALADKENRVRGAAKGALGGAAVASLGGAAKGVVDAAQINHILKNNKTSKALLAEQLAIPVGTAMAVPAAIVTAELNKKKKEGGATPGKHQYSGSDRIETALKTLISKRHREGDYLNDIIGNPKAKQRYEDRSQTEPVKTASKDLAARIMGVSGYGVSIRNRIDRARDK